MPHAGAGRVLSGEQSGTGGCALRHDIGIFEAHAIAGQRVEMRRGHLLRAVAAEGGPALIVREDEQDVWTICGESGQQRAKDGEKEAAYGVMGRQNLMRGRTKAVEWQTCNWVGLFIGLACHARHAQSRVGKAALLRGSHY